MDAVKFIEERERMCKMYGGCTGCPGYDDGVCMVGITTGITPVKQIELLEKWSAAHPRKTRQSVFLEHYPNAPRDRNKLLTACPKCLDADVSCVDKNATVKKFKSCDDCREEFWGQEIE